MIRRNEPDPGEGLDVCERCGAREVATTVGMRDVCKDCEEDEQIEQGEAIELRRFQEHHSA